MPTAGTDNTATLAGTGAETVPDVLTTLAALLGSFAGQARSADPTSVQPMPTVLQAKYATLPTASAFVRPARPATIVAVGTYATLPTDTALIPARETWPARTPTLIAILCWATAWPRPARWTETAATLLPVTPALSSADWVRGEADDPYLYQIIIVTINYYCWNYV